VYFDFFVLQLLLLFFLLQQIARICIMDRRENVMDRSGNMMGAPEMKRSRLMAPSTGGAPVYGQQQQVGTAGGGGTLRSSKVSAILSINWQKTLFFR
jgi:hypothetical protein